MTQATLFDADSPPAPAPPRLPVEPWLVAELVELGVAKETAEGYSLRQAFGVRAKLARAGGTKAKKGQALADPDAPQVFCDGPVDPLVRGASPLERAAVADSLEAVVTEARAGQATEGEVYRVLRASVYALTGKERERVAMGLVNLLRGK